MLSKWGCILSKAVKCCKKSPKVPSFSQLKIISTYWNNSILFHNSSIFNTFIHNSKLFQYIEITQISSKNSNFHNSKFCSTSKPSISNIYYIPSNIHHIVYTNREVIYVYCILHIVYLTLYTVYTIYIYATLYIK